jgi:hypothetical protein
MIFRFVKSISLFGVMFFSLRYIGVDAVPALTASLIPLVLGFVGVLTVEAFGLAAIVFIIAALSALLPPGSRNLLHYVETAVGKVSSSSGIKDVPTTGVDNKKTSVKSPDMVSAEKSK